MLVVTNAQHFQLVQAECQSGRSGVMNNVVGPAVRSKLVRRGLPPRPARGLFIHHRSWSTDAGWAGLTTFEGSCKPCRKDCARRESSVMWRAREGPVVVFLHGLFGALSNFEDLRALLEAVPVVIPMLPLYTMPMLNTNVGALAEHLHRFILYKGWDQVTLLGNSWVGTWPGLYSRHRAGEGHGAHRQQRTLRERLRRELSPSRGQGSSGGRWPSPSTTPKFATDELVEECYETVNDKGRLIASCRWPRRHPPQHGQGFRR